MNTRIAVSYSAVVKNSFKAICSLRQLCDPALHGTPYYIERGESPKSSFKLLLPTFSMKKRLTYTWH